MSIFTISRGCSATIWGAQTRCFSMEGAGGIYHPGLKRNDFSWYGGYGPVLGVVD